MLEYVAKTLHVEITRHPLDSERSLPLYLGGLFDCEKWTALGTDFIVASPRESLAVKTLAKHEAKLRSIFSLPIAFGYDGTTEYRAARLVEAGLPFIANGKQIYLPFLGVALSKEHGRMPALKTPGAGKVSPQTQRFVLMAIYENLTNLNVTQAAELLGIAKITASRVFDELWTINPAWIATSGRTRRFVRDADRAAFWHKALSHLFNPAVREYRLNRIPADGERLPLSGISAVSHYSMLEDDPFPTFAVTKAQEQELGLRGGGLADWEQWDDPACAIQVMRYRLDSMDGAAIDPLSAILSLSEEDRGDPRVEGAIEDIVREVLGQ